MTGDGPAQVSPTPLPFGPTPRGRRFRRVSPSLIAALIAVGVALALPSPKAPTPLTAPEPLRLAGVWPDATPFTIPGILPDGSSYQPYAVIDPAVSIGIVTGVDADTTRLVVRSGATVRPLRTMATARGEALAAVTVVDGQIYWAETAAGASGDGTTVWRADLTGSGVRRLAADPGQIYYRDSAHDVAVADGSVSWAVETAGGERSEIRSVSVQGGRVRARPLDRLFGLTAWPWATTSTSGEPGEAHLMNLGTGERRVAPAGPEEFLACSPTWCRVTTLVDDGQDVTYAIRRWDGSDERALTDTPMNVDVALLDRFDLLGSTADDGPRSYQRLSLYDIANDRTVLVADATTGTVGARGGFLWWSTGDNETLQWRALDLRELR